MQVSLAFLRSKVARRIFFLFVLCALVPITALALVSFVQVRGQLHAQSHDRLRQAAKTTAMSIIERLRFLDAELELLRPVLAADLAVPPAARQQPALQDDRHFTALDVFANGEHQPLFGALEHAAALPATAADHLESGHPFLYVDPRSSQEPRLLFVKPLAPADGAGPLLTAAVSPSYVWFAGDEENLPANADLMVFDSDERLLVSTLAGTVELPAEITARFARQASGEFEWTHDGTRMLASYWSIPLVSLGMAPSGSWHVVLAESMAVALAPLSDFNRVFPLVVLMSLWVVLLLSSGQIRRSLVPLERLREGTRRIARRDFDTRVDVTSGDEFEELAGSFNIMASRLGRQFRTLATMAEIDRAVLSALDIDEIVDTVLTQIPDVVRCDGVAVTLVGLGGPPKTLTKENPWLEPDVREVGVTGQEMASFRDNLEHLVYDGRSTLPAFLAHLAQAGYASFVAFPIFLNEELAAIISLAYHETPEPDPEHLSQARQLADQVGVALSNARLIEELDALNWGALRALARTIDAKSPWTAGHSERVTELALEIGRELELDDGELDALRRGGLLHDIGKIATPAHILDKKESLTPEEVHQVRAHPRKGAEILEPLAAYSDVIPIVLQHHEWWNGGGYPDGLAGEEIDFKARIFAVADVYDALSSDRPYRTGDTGHDAVERIRQGAGVQFDPRVVEAFVAVMERRGAAGARDSTPPARLSDRADTSPGCAGSGRSPRGG